MTPPLIAGIDPVSIVIQVAIAIALSLAAAALQKKPRQKSQRIDDSPTMSATRGDPIPPLIGRDRLGPIVGWTGNRRWFQFSEGPIAIEDAEHKLCVGPAYRLHAIRASGKIIWKGPITRDSHPSGSQVAIPGVGSFRIYWGEQDQPIDDYLASRTGVPSRWKNVCWLLWIDRAIGSAAQWELHDYDLEVRPLPEVELVGSSSWYPATVFLNRERKWLIFTTTPLTRAIYVLHDGFDLRTEISATGEVDGAKILVWDQPASPGVEYEFTVTSINPPDLDLQGMQVIFVAEELPTLTGFKVSVYAETEDDGANPAHILWQFLFAKPPHGRALPTSLFQIASLEAIGVEADLERLPSHVLVTNGEELRAVIAGILQDLGVLLVWDPRISKFRFVMIREPGEGSVIALPSGAILDPIPEVITAHAPVQVSCPTFIYKDRLRSYRDETVPRADDASASLEGFCRVEKIEMLLPRDGVTAAIMAGRREQETLGQLSAYEISVNRNARDILPGDVIVLPEAQGFPGALRVFRARPTPLSSRVTLQCALDAYGADPSDIFDEDDDGDGGEVTEPMADLIVRPLELSPFLAPDVITVSVARVRADTAVQLAEQWISPDDDAFRFAENEVVASAGGTLLEDLTADSDFVLETGFEITPVGPSDDLDELPDLRGDLNGWRSGRLVAILDDEVLFVRNVSAVSPSVYRLEGVIRARFESNAGVHASGAQVVICELANLARITDPIFAPNVTRYLKSLPRTYRTIGIDEVPSVAMNLRGRSIKPMQPTALRIPPVRGRFNAFLAGDDLELAWCYRSRYGLANRTGAGMQGFGRIAGETDPDGVFRLEVLDPFTLAIKRTVPGLTVPRYTYTDADLVSDFGSRPSAVLIRVRETVSGYDSTPTDLILGRLDA